MNAKDFRPGDRVELLCDNSIAPVGAPTPTGTVTKVGRKYITIERDSAVYGGSCRKLTGTATTEVQLVPGPGVVRKIEGRPTAPSGRITNTLTVTRQTTLARAESEPAR